MDPALIAMAVMVGLVVLVIVYYRRQSKSLQSALLGYAQRRDLTIESYNRSLFPMYASSWRPKLFFRVGGDELGIVLLEDSSKSTCISLFAPTLKVLPNMKKGSAAITDHPQLNALIEKSGLPVELLHTQEGSLHLWLSGWDLSDDSLDRAIRLLTASAQAAHRR